MQGGTQQQILEAVERLIRSKGLARVTTKEIARATGLSEGALYRHFDHKEEVFFAILMKYLPSFIDTFNQHVPGTATVSGNLEAIALAALSYYEQLIPLSASFFADTQLLARFRDMLQQINGGPQSVFERIAVYIQEEQQLGRIDKQVPALSIATLLLGPCFQRIFVRQLLGSDPFGKTDQQFAQELVQALLPGLLHPQ